VFPQLLKIGDFVVPTYGVLAAAGLVFGLMVTARLARRDGLDEDSIWNLGVLVILAGIIGAKLLLVINAWAYYSADWRRVFSFDMLQAGGVWYGGLLAGFAIGIAYAVRRKLPIMRTWDCFSPGIAFGHALGRLGCFAAGCCYGKPTDLPWAVTFTNPQAAQLVGTPLNIALHPTQIYEFLAEIIIFATLLWLFPRRQFAGQVTAAYLLLYGPARYFLEFARNDPDRGSIFGGAMTVTQLISILLVMLGAAMWVGLNRRAKPVAVSAA
jgi:phosphatidylglycerol---prolipoprotein diacylglyceryl transferase